MTPTKKCVEDSMSDRELLNSYLDNSANVHRQPTIGQWGAIITLIKKYLSGELVEKEVKST